MKPDESKFSTVPVGRLGIIVHPSCAALGDKIDQYIVNWRRERNHNHKSNIVFKDYEKDSFIIPSTCARFGTGEAKALISDSVEVRTYISSRTYSITVWSTPSAVTETICRRTISTPM